MINSITKILKVFLNHLIRYFFFIINTKIAIFYYIKKCLQNFLNEIYFKSHIINIKNIFKDMQNTF